MCNLSYANAFNLVLSKILLFGKGLICCLQVLSIWTGLKSCLVRSLPDNKILTRSDFKEFADNKIESVPMIKFVLNCLENILGKQENAGYWHFLLFPKCFQKLSFTGS